ncbi:sigma-70 family RNA polymerase sigma factor [Litchfieldia alkalitelluris]|uniref:sigma-70 family RNA polymerase sigma factor n=1 Tax=Litchfieldia alkalitelluris TaxID=304268 RepID=UPI000998A65B|nr:sigma-70 family RNA polymerase sigma factor [Litchfieldia alkalitelluris]
MIDYTEHIGLVHKVITNLFGSHDNARTVANRKGIDLDDLIQVGTIALWESAEKFDESKGFTFSTYAFKNIRFLIMSEINRNNPIHISMHIPTSERIRINSNVVWADKEFGEQSLFGKVSAPVNVEDEAITEADLSRMLDALNERERYIISARLNEVSFRELGAEMGLSHQGVHLILKKAIKKLKARGIYC